MKAPSKIDTARYSATVSKNTYLGDCISIAYTLTQDEISKNFLTGDSIFMFVKTKQIIFPFREDAEALFQKSSFSSDRSIPLRIMSSCLTGLLGDTMCNCYDDMRRHLLEIRDMGEGVFMYLPQEGQSRGIRLKLDDHRLQYGFDAEGAIIPQKTFEEATSTLVPDEKFDIRSYSFVRDCLETLGLDQINFLWLGNVARMEKFKVDTGLNVVNSTSGNQ